MAIPKLRIGIELIDEPGWIGGTLYLRNLVVVLARLPEEERPVVRLLGSPGAISAFLREAGPLPFSQLSAPGRLARFWRKSRPAVESTLDVVYPGFGASPPGAVVVKWIPDFQHRHLPHLFEPGEIAARDASIAEVAGKTGVVVLSSEVAKADFERFWPDHAVTPMVWRFCSVIDLGMDADSTVPTKYGLPSKFLYLPNQFWTHKNHRVVLEALHQIRKGGGASIPLVCTGAQVDRRNESHFAQLQSYIRDAGLHEQVQLLGLIDRRDQVEVLRHAAAVIQPSLFEGWSTVVEDARAIGRPMFLSDIPVHREQAPARTWYFDPTSSGRLADLLVLHWDDLRPGPDSATESEARTRAAQRMLETARAFCRIARHARDASGTA